MTIAELIARLQEMPPDLPVYIYSDEYGEAYRMEPQNVRIWHIDEQEHSPSPQTITDEKPGNALLVNF